MNETRLKSFKPEFHFDLQHKCALVYKWSILHQSSTFTVVLSHEIKIPSSLLPLGGLGPSTDTTANRKRQDVSLLTPQQSERYLVKFLWKKCLKINSIISRKILSLLICISKMNATGLILVEHIHWVHCPCKSQKGWKETYMYM